MQIHEQEWTYRGLSGDVIGPDGLSLTSDGAPDDALRLIAAAPKMARALLADMVPWEDGLMHDEHRCPIFSGGKCAEWCAAKRAALRSAGVL